VDASMIRARRKAERINAETGESCPDCGYIISAASFPKVCTYCGCSF
jgi:rubrerythrin